MGYITRQVVFSDIEKAIEFASYINFDKSSAYFVQIRAHNNKERIVYAEDWDGNEYEIPYDEITYMDLLIACELEEVEE